MRSYMYLRPGNLYKDFIIEESVADVKTGGRVMNSYQDKEMLRGALADADARQKLHWQQLEHPISHVITQDGPPKAKPADRLILGNRIFDIQGVNNIGSLDIKTLYYVEERADVR